MSNTFYANLETESPSTNNGTPETPKQPLALPEVPHNGTTQLDMSSGSTTVKLDHLGPMVVNVDGTLARITNWQEMTEAERSSTLRIVGIRNKSRLEVLKKKQADQEATKKQEGQEK